MNPTRHDWAGSPTAGDAAGHCDHLGVPVVINGFGAVTPDGGDGRSAEAMLDAALDDLDVELDSASLGWGDVRVVTIRLGDDGLVTWDAIAQGDAPRP